MIEIIMLPKPFDLLPEKAVRFGAHARGAAVFRQDDVAQGPCWIATGRVELVRHTEAGTKVVLHRASAGETLAEASIFSDIYHCDAIVTEAAQIAVIDKAAVIAMLRCDQDFAMDLLARLAGQVQGYRRRLELAAIRSARDRVLAALAEQPGYASVTAFASQIGLTHEATYRALSRLVAEGQVKKVARGRYRVIRIPAPGPRNPQP